ncbi:MAG: hypothetical protein SFY68_03330 [Candidatus Sumerlaeia bacterium]|nr:hypothetical protein [Candidatus Sumerlaeia bacterium]
MNVLPTPDFVSFEGKPAWRKSRIPSVIAQALLHSLLPFLAELWLTFGDDSYSRLSKSETGYKILSWQPDVPFIPGVTNESLFRDQTYQSLNNWLAEINNPEEQIGTFRGQSLYFRVHIEFMTLAQHLDESADPLT